MPVGVRLPWSEFVADTPWILTAANTEGEPSTLALWDSRTGKRLNPVFEITFRTFPGLDYVIEAAEGLIGFAPVPESGFTANGYSETIQVEVPAGIPSFFFRAARQTATD